MSSRSTDQLSARRDDSREADRLFVPFPDVEVEHRELACLNGNANSDVSLSVRSGYHQIKSSGQCHQLGAFVTPRNVIFHVFKELSVNRVDCVRAVRVIGETSIIEFI